MGINIKNNTRLVDAKLGQANITRYGKTWAFQFGLDGITIAYSTVPNAPSTLKQYLEGDDTLTMIGIASNVDKLCDYALASFPNLKEIYLFKSDDVVEIEDDLSYLTSLTKIYVPSELLNTYKSTYTTLATLFDVIIDSYTLTIPYVDDSTLTTEYLDEVLGMLSNAEKQIVEKVVIPTDFTQISALYCYENYDWSILPILDNNIWYGNRPMSSFLPIEYQEVEYIQSNGSQQAIDTGWYPTLSKTRIVIDGYTTQGTSLFGSNYQGFGITGVYVAGGAVEKIYYVGQSYTSDVLINVRNVFDLNKNEIYVNDNLIYSFTLSTALQLFTIYLMARNIGSINDYGPCRIYSCQIYEEDVLVRNFVPCYRRSDGEIGLYDLVNGELHTNIGTGTFTKGQDV